MEQQLVNDYISEVLDLGLPCIQNTSRIQREIMTSTQLSQDTTSIISGYYFPIDIDAVVVLSSIDKRLYRIIIMLACELGCWSVVRMATKKKRAHLLEFDGEVYMSHDGSYIDFNEMAFM